MITELESYEQFGKRCGLKAYRKLAALLTQNLRKGSKGLSELLRAEADQAFEERKAAAKKRGEEAGTKLLLSNVYDAFDGTSDCYSSWHFYLFKCKGPQK